MEIYFQVPDYFHQRCPPLAEVPKAEVARRKCFKQIKGRTTSGLLIEAIHLRQRRTVL